MTRRSPSSSRRLPTRRSATSCGRQTEVSIAVVDHPDLVLVGVGHQAVLVMRRRVAGRAVLHVEQDHRVARRAAEAVDLGHRDVGAEVQVGVLRAVEVLEVVDHRGLGPELAQEQGRAPARVADDQVGADRGADRLHRLVDAGRVPDPVLERAREVVGLLGGAAAARRYWMLLTPPTVPGGFSETNVQVQPRSATSRAAMCPNCAGKLRWTKRTCMRAGYSQLAEARSNVLGWRWVRRGAAQDELDTDGVCTRIGRGDRCPRCRRRRSPRGEDRSGDGDRAVLRIRRGPGFEAEISMPRRPRGWVIVAGAAPAGLDRRTTRRCGSSRQTAEALVAARRWLAPLPEARGLPVAIAGGAEALAAAAELALAVDALVLERECDGPAGARADAGARRRPSRQPGGGRGIPRRGAGRAGAPALNHRQRRLLARGLGAARREAAGARAPDRAACEPRSRLSPPALALHLSSGVAANAAYHGGDDSATTRSRGSCR